MSELDDDGDDADTAADDPVDADHSTADDETAELPADIVDEAERLAKLERAATDDNEAQAYADHREDLLEDHAFTSRIREDEDATLVCHPEEWHDDDDGVIRTDRIEDLSRAVEIPLEGTEDPDDWEAVDDHNRDLAAQVREAHGDVHGDNAEVLADFVSNHYAKPIESLTGPELTEFRTDYYVRNVWPSKKQRAVVDDSIRLVYETAGEPVPDYDR